MKNIFLIIIFSFTIWSIKSQNVTIPDLGTLIGSTTTTLWTNKTVIQFLGVKYAKAPSGVNRFKPPELQIPWPGDVHNVSTYARCCPVLEYYKNMTEDELQGDLEDCLIMDIYTRNISASNAILVYIHGGGFDKGASFRRPPGYFLEKEVVYVVPQYRLGVFGFTSTNTPEVDGNLGILDSIAALEWIQRYIHHFGGDPNKVTIWGGSSSAMMISAMLFSPKVSDNLFRGVILQSGTYFGPLGIDNDPVSSARKLLQYTNCTPTETVEDLNKCLMTEDVFTLIEAYDKNKANGYSARMTINNVLPNSPTDILYGLKNVKARNISLFIGGTKDDGMAFLPGVFEIMQQVSQGDVFKALGLLSTVYGVQDYTGSMAGYLAAHLFTQDQMMEKNLTKLYLGFIDIANTMMIKAPTLAALHLQAKDYPNKTFLYSFEYDGEFAGHHDIDHFLFDLYTGIVHSDENVYLFPYPEYKTKLNDDDKYIAQIMVDLWTSFTIDGVPSSDKTPEFPPVTRFSGPFLRINTTSTIGNDFLKDFSLATNSIKNNGNRIKLAIEVNLFLVFIVLLKQYVI